MIEIGGLTPGPGESNPNDGYDQVNVTNLAALGGILQVSLINEFIPEAGDTFDFLTFGSIDGDFAIGQGLYGFGDGSVYLDVVQQDDRLQLVAREVPLVARVIATTQAANDVLGTFYGDYFSSGGPITVGGDLNIGGVVAVSGSITFDSVPSSTTCNCHDTRARSSPGCLVFAHFTFQVSGRFTVASVVGRPV